MTGSGQRTILRPPIRGRAVPNDGPPFRADHVGRLIRSQKLIDARDVRDAGTLSNEALHEIEDEAVLDAIAMQERVGLHSITDGELRQFNWRDGFFESVDGFSEECVPSSFIFTEFSGERRRGIPIPVAIGKLRRRKNSPPMISPLHRLTRSGLPRRHYRLQPSITSSSATRDWQNLPTPTGAPFSALID